MVQSSFVFLWLGNYEVPVSVVVCAALDSLERFTMNLSDTPQANTKLRDIYFVSNDLPTIKCALREFCQMIQSTTL